MQAAIATSVAMSACTVASLVATSVTWHRGVVVAHQTGNLEARVQVPADAETFSALVSYCIMQ